MNEITIDLGDGDKAEMITVLLHGTQREIKKIVQSCLIYPEMTGRFNEDGIMTPDKIAGDVKIDSEKVDSTGMDDAYILGQVVTWSFGEETAMLMRNETGHCPVNKENLDKLPEAKYQILKKKADELFVPPLAGSGTGN